MMIFVDTNVVIYSLDSRDPKKQARCLGWLTALGDRRAMTLSPQVVLEARNVVLRKLKMPAKFADAAIDRLLSWCSAPLTAAEFRSAVALAERWKLSWWDAVLLTSAKAAACSHFLTEDTQSSAVVAGIRIIDPFKTAPEEIIGTT